MTDNCKSYLIPEPLPLVRKVLLDPARIPDWNPAFLSLRGPARADTGVRYPITVRGGLRGTFEYVEISSDQIGTAWQVPGFHETGTWRLESRDGGTVVTHEYEHSGPLARVLRGGFRGVAEFRLQRLAARVIQYAQATSPAP